MCPQKKMASSLCVANLLFLLLFKPFIIFMKKELISFLTIAFFLFSGCSKEDSSLNYEKEIALQNYFFTAAKSQNFLEYSLREIDNQEYTISANQSSTSDRTISIAVAPELLENFNSTQKTAYQLLPQNAYHISATELTLNANEKVSQPFKINLLSLNELDKTSTYCLPISIVETTDKATLNELYKTIYLVIKPKSDYVAIFNHGTRYSVPFQNEEKFSSLTACSFETLIRVHDFGETSKQKISTIMGIEEYFLLRFGDDNIGKNQLQFSGKDQFKVTSKTPLNLNEWYHIAMVYDGRKVKLYINGTLDIEHEASLGTVNLNKKSPNNIGFQISQAYIYDERYLHAAISEMRIWEKALSENEIRSHAYFLPMNQRAGLIAYWPFNDNIQTILDHSKNGLNLEPSQKESSDIYVGGEFNNPTWEIIDWPKI